MQGMTEDYFPLAPPPREEAESAVFWLIKTQAGLPNLQSPPQDPSDSASRGRKHAGPENAQPSFHHEAWSPWHFRADGGASLRPPSHIAVPLWGAGPASTEGKNSCAPWQTGSRG